MIDNYQERTKIIIPLTCLNIILNSVKAGQASPCTAHVQPMYIVHPKDANFAKTQKTDKKVLRDRPLLSILVPFIDKLMLTVH